MANLLWIINFRFDLLPYIHFTACMNMVKSVCWKLWFITFHFTATRTPNTNLNSLQNVGMFFPAKKVVVISSNNKNRGYHENKLISHNKKKLLQWAHIKCIEFISTRTLSPELSEYEFLLSQNFDGKWMGKIEYSIRF